MTNELPWEDYDRERLRSGLSYPAGHDFIERCLREAGAVVGSLSFVGGTADPRHTTDKFGLLDLFWFSDVPGHIAFNRARSPASHLFMRVWAVPSGQRRQAAQLLADGLPTACRWAVAALNRIDTGWSSSQHVLTLSQVNQALQIDET